MSGKANKGSSASKFRRGLANSVKNKISQLKKGDITFYFHMPAHGMESLCSRSMGCKHSSLWVYCQLSVTTCTTQIKGWMQSSTGHKHMLWPLQLMKVMLLVQSTW
jgi:hypothetical protein